MSTQAIKNVLPHGAAADQGAIQSITIRIPAGLHKTIAHEAIEREQSSQQLWIDAMRAFLKIKA